MMEEKNQMAVGTVIDNRYEIIEPIGRGGFAMVYKVHHQQLDRPAALKVLDPITSGTTDNFIKRFLSEARIAANIQHTHAVTIYDFGVVAESQPYIAMELLEGHDLEEELTKFGPISPERAKALFLPVLDALAVGHKRNVVHKDLKPSNLFLNNPRTPQERLVVLDYGIARIADDDSPRLTQTGGYTGTPAYMPPEYIQHSIVAPTNDVYQMGLIMLETITGVQAVQAKTSVAYMVAHLSGEKTIPEWFAKTDLGKLLTASVTTDHEQRFANAGLFRDALEKTALPNLSAEVDPVGHTMATGAISAQVVPSPSSSGENPNYTPTGANPRGVILPTEQTAPAPLTSRGKPAHQSPNEAAQNVVVANASVIQNQGQVTPESAAPSPYIAPAAAAIPAVVNPGLVNPGVANPGANPGVVNPGVANPGVVNPGVANPGVANPQGNQPAPFQYQYPPRRKSRWPMFMFGCLSFVALICAAPFIYVYGYHGGFTEYFAALEREYVPDIDTVELNGVDITNVGDALKVNASDFGPGSFPGVDLQFMYSMLLATYMVDHSAWQFENFENSVSKYGVDSNRLWMPSGVDNMLESADSQLGTALGYDAGTGPVRNRAEKLRPELQKLIPLLEDLLEAFADKRGGSTGKALLRKTKTQIAKVVSVYEPFRQATNTHARAYFKRCSSDGDALIGFQCKLLLSAEEVVSAAIDNNTSKFDAAMKRFSAQATAYKKYTRANDKALMKRFHNGYMQGSPHRDFANSVKEFKSEARQWRGGKRRDRPWFVRGEFHSMIMQLRSTQTLRNTIK